MSNQPRVNSAVSIARLLGCEGFSDRVGNLVEKYWRKRCRRPSVPEAKFHRLERAMSELAAKLTEGDRRVLGKFISWHKAMSFDVGLRIGLTTRIYVRENGDGERRVGSVGGKESVKSA